LVHARCFILVLTLLCGFHGAQTDSQNPADREGKAKVEELIRLVLEKNPAASLNARKIGPGANGELAKLAENPDPKVRQIALYCLDETGGAEATRVFIRLLLDSDSQVRGAALSGLTHHADPAAIPQMFQTYDTSRDPYVHQQLFLILAKIPGVSLRDVRIRFLNEHDLQAREGGVVALARLGEPEAQQDFARMLQKSSGRDRARFLDYCRYIAAAWLVNPIGPLLDDKTNMVRIGVDGRRDFPEYLRACDIAVNLIAEFGGKQFSFAVKSAANYTDEQLAEVKKSLPPSR
jgi:HEAT repeat protein